MPKNDGAHHRPSFESLDTNTGGDIDFDESLEQDLIALSQLK